MKNKKMTAAIVILSVLLAISVTALCVLILRDRFGGHETVTVPENYIGSSGTPTAGIPRRALSGAPVGEAVPPTLLRPSGNLLFDNEDEEKTALKLELYKRHADDNIAFHETNMFPGDSVTRYFCVQVSYNKQVFVGYRANIREGYQILSDVLRCRVKLLNSGEELYDGLMRDMPVRLEHELNAEGNATEELYYEITVYLDTSVGNYYQDAELVADFVWFADDSSLVNPPQTGATPYMLLWALVGVTSLTLLILLILKRRKSRALDE